MRLLWLADVLRGAGLTVHEEPGWQTRGGDTFAPRGVICHATASSRTSTPAGDINVICYTGSATAPAPISQLYLARTGEWWVLASGRCNHVRIGWAGPFQGLGNGNLVGIEAANDDISEAWPPAQYDSYTRGVAAILRHTGWPPPVGHKEHQPGAKVDPTFDMTLFRGRVAAALAGETVDFEDVLTALADGTTKAGAVADKYPGVWPHLQGRTLADVKKAAQLDVAAVAAAVAATLVTDPRFIDALVSAAARLSIPPPPASDTQQLLATLAAAARAWADEATAAGPPA